MTMLIDAYRFGGGGGGGNTDDFSTNTLSSYTEYADNAASYSISGGFLLASTGPANKQSILTRNGVTVTDGIVSCVILEAENAGLGFRLTDNNNYYVATIVDDSAINPPDRNKVALYKKVAGSYTQLGSTATISFVRGTSHTFSVELTGTAIVVKFDGTTLISVTDSAHASGLSGPRTNGGALKVDSFTWP